MLQVTEVLILLSVLSGVSAIPLSDFYPFGDSHNDTALPPCIRCGSEFIPLSQPFTFYGRDITDIVVRKCFT